MGRTRDDELWRSGAHRVFAVVTELHARGYQGLRVLPGINSSGTWWRCAVFSKRDELAGSDIWSRAWIYSAAAGPDLFGLGDVSAVGVAGLANMAARAFPDLLAAAYGEDRPYVRWFKRLVFALDRGFLPVAYADWYEWRPPHGSWAVLSPSGEWRVFPGPPNAG